MARKMRFTGREGNGEIPGPTDTALFENLNGINNTRCTILDSQEVGILKIFNGYQGV
jgi:hypothetical protein